MTPIARSPRRRTRRSWLSPHRAGARSPRSLGPPARCPGTRSDAEPRESARDLRARLHFRAPRVRARTATTAALATLWRPVTPSATSRRSSGPLSVKSLARRSSRSAHAPLSCPKTHHEGVATHRTGDSAHTGLVKDHHRANRAFDQRRKGEFQVLDGAVMIEVIGLHVGTPRRRATTGRRPKALVDFKDEVTRSPMSIGADAQHGTPSRRASSRPAARATCTIIEVAVVFPCVPVSPMTRRLVASSPSNSPRLSKRAPRARALETSTLSSDTAGDQSTTWASRPWAWSWPRKTRTPTDSSSTSVTESAGRYHSRRIPFQPAATRRHSCPHPHTHDVHARAGFDFHELLRASSTTSGDPR